MLCIGCVFRGRCGTCLRLLCGFGLRNLIFHLGIFAILSCRGLVGRRIAGGQFQHAIWIGGGGGGLVGNCAADFAGTTLVGAGGRCVGFFSGLYDCTGQTLPIGLPILGLYLNFLFGGVLCHAVDFVLGRHAQDGTRLDPVHIAAGKAIRIDPVHGHDHAFQADIGRAGVGRDLAQGVATMHGDGARAFRIGGGG